MRTRHVIMIVASVLVLGVLLFPYYVIRAGRQSVYTSIEAIQAPAVIIVFGAGLRRDGTPSDALRDRLEVAAQVYKAGKAKRILVSGDNRFENYNEPQAMHDTLVNELGVPEDMVVSDHAGRRTYDTCARARELWGVDEAILVTQGFHLPRAIWTCEHLGIDSSGVSASLQPYVRGTSFNVREIGAIYKAFIDAYLWPPTYVHGSFEGDIDVDN